MSQAKIELDQLTTFYVGKELFGIEVMKVQEVTGSPNVISVPLAPNFVRGLINLRGQIATAIGLSELFSKTKTQEHQMSVVCRIEGNLVSLIVDTIGDVVEVSKDDFEEPPLTMPVKVKKYIKGIYKMNGVLLSVLNLDAIAQELSPVIEANVSLNN